jgi:hypothetical protein
LIPALICIGCHVSEFDSPKALNSYILSSENHLSHVAEVGGFTIRATYRPTDLLVHQETEGEEYDSSRVYSLRKKYENHHYFIVSFSKSSKEALHHREGGKGHYSKLVQTLSFRMPDYVTLTTSAKETIPIGDFTLNRTYGLGESTDVLFVFSRNKTKGKEWVQLNVNEFGLGVGNHRFRFLCKDIDNVPRINFEKRNGRRF